MIDLLGAFPGREWKMQQIVAHVAKGRPSSKQQRNRYRQGVRRVLIELVGCKVIESMPARRGGTALYRWKCDTQLPQSD